MQPKRLQPLAGREKINYELQQLLRNKPLKNPLIE